MTNFKNVLTLEELKLEFTSGIGQSVIEELESQGDDWYNHLQEIINHGCISGVVSSLIYYNDTEEFHDENESEIDLIISEYLDISGLTSNQFIGGIYEIQQLKNFKSWFAFEYIANEINNHLENM